MIYYSDDGLTVRAMTEADAEALAAGEIAQPSAFRRSRAYGTSPALQNLPAPASPFR